MEKDRGVCQCNELDAKSAPRTCRDQRTQLGQETLIPWCLVHTAIR